MFPSEKQLPNPPELNHLKIPMYFEYIHPYTKWMINMIRGDISHRLLVMIKERPELFQQVYQIPDQPHVILNDKYDRKSVFHQSAVLYLNPLGLAIYMRRMKSVEILIQSGINTLQQKGYATEVYKRGIQSGGDICEVIPITISISREFFTSIPILLQCKTNRLSKNFVTERFDVNQTINVVYENRKGMKTYNYKNLLTYTIFLLRKRGNFPLTSFFEIMVNTSEKFRNMCSTFSEVEKKSVFRELCQVAYYSDLECRITLQIIRSLEILLKNKCCPWQPVPPRKYDLLSRLKSNSLELIDQDCSIGILLALFNRIIHKKKNGAVDYLGRLLFKTLEFTQWRETFLECRIDHLYEYFINLPEQLNISCETVSLSRLHVKSMVDLDKERDVNSEESLAKVRRYRRTCIKSGSRQHNKTAEHLSKPTKLPSTDDKIYSRIKGQWLIPSTIYSYKTTQKGNHFKEKSPSEEEEKDMESDFDSGSLSKQMDNSENFSATGSSISMNLQLQSNNSESIKKSYPTSNFTENDEMDDYDDIVTDGGEESKIKADQLNIENYILNTSQLINANEATNIDTVFLDEELENLIEEESRNIQRSVQTDKFDDESDIEFELSDSELENYEEKIIEEMCGEYLNPRYKTKRKSIHYNLNQRLNSAC